LSVAYDGDVWSSSSINLNGGILLGNGQSDNSLIVNIASPIGIGPVSGSAGGTALIDAATGTTLDLQGVMASAGNTGTNNLVVNSGAGDNGTVSMMAGGNTYNTYNGTTVISNGVLDVASPLSLASSTLNYNDQGGYLWIDGQTSITLGGLTGAQNLWLTNLAGGGVTLTVGNNNGSTTYSGNMSDAGFGGALVKAGSGTLTLTGTNNYIGTTTANTGALAVNGGSLVASNTLTLNGGTLHLTNGTISVPALDMGIGSTAAGTVIVDSSTASFGTTRISSGTVNGGIITINSGTVAFGTFTDRRDSSANGAADATGGLTINGGTVTASNVLISTGNSAANLHLKGGSLTIGNTNTTGGFTVGSGTSGTRGGFVTQTGGSLTYLGADGLLLGVSLLLATGVY
jgi:autotransporter-associated beta strand protein